MAPSALAGAASLGCAPPWPAQPRVSVAPDTTVRYAASGRRPRFIDLDAMKHHRTTRTALMLSHIGRPAAVGVPASWNLSRRCGRIVFERRQRFHLWAMVGAGRRR